MSAPIIVDGGDSTGITNDAGECTITCHAVEEPLELLGCLITVAKGAVFATAKFKETSSTGRDFIVTFYGANGNRRTNTVVEYVWAALANPV